MVEFYFLKVVQFSSSQTIPEYKHHLLVIFLMKLGSENASENALDYVRLEQDGNIV